MKEWSEALRKYHKAVRNKSDELNIARLKKSLKKASDKLKENIRDEVLKTEES